MPQSKKKKRGKKPKPEEQEGTALLKSVAEIGRYPKCHEEQQKPLNPNT
jgi:hypothetical protein